MKDNYDARWEEFHYLVSKIARKHLLSVPQTVELDSYFSHVITETSDIEVDALQSQISSLLTKKVKELHTPSVTSEGKATWWSNNYVGSASYSCGRKPFKRVTRGG